MLRKTEVGIQISIDRGLGLHMQAWLQKSLNYLYIVFAASASQPIFHKSLFNGQ
jgi:hypothetical protein